MNQPPGNQPLTDPLAPSPRCGAWGYANHRWAKNGRCKRCNQSRADVAAAKQASGGERMALGAMIIGLLCSVSLYAVAFYECARVIFHW